MPERLSTPASCERKNGLKSTQTTDHYVSEYIKKYTPPHTRTLGNEEKSLPWEHVL